MRAPPAFPADAGSADRAVLCRLLSQETETGLLMPPPSPRAGPVFANFGGLRPAWKRTIRQSTPVLLSVDAFAGGSGLSASNGSELEHPITGSPARSPATDAMNVGYDGPTLTGA